MLRFKCSLTAHFHKCTGEPLSNEQSTSRGNDSVAPQRDADQRLNVDPLDRELNGMFDAIAGNEQILPCRQPVNVPNRLDDENYYTRYTTEDANLKAATTRLAQIKVKLQNGDNRAGNVSFNDTFILLFGVNEFLSNFSWLVGAIRIGVDFPSAMSAHIKIFSNISHVFDKCRPIHVVQSSLPPFTRSYQGIVEAHLKSEHRRSGYL